MGRHHRGGAPQAAQGRSRRAEAAPRRLTAPRELATELDARHRDRDADVYRRAVVVAHLDRAAELAGHERLHDREAEARATSRARTGRAGPTPSSRTSIETCRRRARAARRRGPSDDAVDGNAWSTAFCMSSLSTTASGVATSPGQLAGVAFDLEADRELGRRRPSPRRAARAAARSRRTRTTSPASRDSVSCTIAIERMRRSDSASASRASGDCSRRPWSRSSDAIVCRLFFTRWWISRIVASFDSSMRSRRRRSVTSRISRSAPVGSSSSSIGSTRSSTDDVAALDLLGDRAGGGASRAARGRRRSRSRPGAARCAYAWMPMRCSELTAFGLANCTRVSSSMHDHAVADARRALDLDLVDVERERALGDHLGEPLEHLEVGALELAGAARRTSSTPRA